MKASKNVQKISMAHHDSAFAVIDPAYSIDIKKPADDLVPEAPFWYYGQAECEAFMLMQMLYVSPLEGVDNISAVIPTPDGEIIIEIRNGKTDIRKSLANIRDNR
jgi:hypothetical protein